MTHCYIIIQSFKSLFARHEHCGILQTPYYYVRLAKYMRKFVFVLQVAFVQYDLDLTRARLLKQLKVK